MKSASNRSSGPADLAKLIAAPVSIEDILSKLTPPKHFAPADFANYEPDPRFPSQRAGMETVLGWIQTPIRTNGFFAKLGEQLGIKTQEDVSLGIYLDGGFGVGKTHLLAASYHVFRGKKAYLSFQELMFLVGLQTLTKTFETFSNYEILFLDEFELDDPANTRIASNLIGKLMDRNVRIITTSNTPPGALGENKFSTSDFARELQDIAERFRTLKIDGEDYRVVHEGAIQDVARVDEPVPASKSMLSLHFRDLLNLLSTAHPIRIRNALAHFTQIELRYVSPIDSPNEALRFVYFVDKAYDYDLLLQMDATVAPSEIFSPSVLRGGDLKKYQRTISRLQEMTKKTRNRPFLKNYESN